MFSIISAWSESTPAVASALSPVKATIPQIIKRMTISQRSILQASRFCFLQKFLILVIKYTILPVIAYSIRIGVDHQHIHYLTSWQK
jgi:hypothetical protein